MSREWKPGDVALLTLSDGRRYIAEVRHDFTRPQWFGSWSGFSIELDSENVAGARPLVVIDPEDREQVERLARVAHVAMTGDVPAWSTLSTKDQMRRIDALAMALFAELEPPKPEEPTGLGAVVATEGDGDYIRVSVELLNPWLNVQTGTQVHWDRINAVRVLSPGVEVSQ